MRFTIGIPAYKATFLKECIDSILAQTFTDFELIVVNDASPDNIQGILDGYQSSKIKYYKNDKNFGAVHVVDNWNKCLSFAKGEFFVLMGDDDMLAPNYLQEFDNLIRKYPKCGVYHCRTIIIDEKSKPIGLTEPRPEFESVYDSIYQRMRENRLFFISDYVFSTKKILENGGFYKLPLAWASDDISAFIASLDNGIAHTNQPVFMYRRNAQTISSTGNVNFKMDATLGEESWLKKFLELVPTNDIDFILRDNIKNDLKLFIQKKKVRTIYADTEKNIFTTFLKWYSLRKKYQITTVELLYASLMRIKERKKNIYV